MCTCLHVFLVCISCRDLSCLARLLLPISVHRLLIALRRRVPRGILVGGLTGKWSGDINSHRRRCILA